jgi:hypothetical protein
MEKGWRQFSNAVPGLLPGILSLLCAATAVAAPPPGRGGMIQTLGATQPGVSRLDGLRATAAAAAAHTLSRLDLRAPESEHMSSPGAQATSEAPAFPSMRRAGEYSSPTRLQDDLPSLGDRGGPAVRIPSRAEQMAQRFRREGLPVARLFESRSALVSLGLNQRGKPGIWLIQKIP